MSKRGPFYLVCVLTGLCLSCDEDSPLADTMSPVDLGLDLPVAADVSVDQKTPPTPDSAPPQKPARYGVHSALGYGSPHGLDTHIQKLKQLGVQLSRNGVHWWVVEEQQGTYNWNLPKNPVDDVVDKLTAAGIEPLMIITGSPAWANHSDTQYDGSNDPHGDRPHLYVPTDAAQFDVWVGKYAEFVRAVVRRYRDRVKLWELWNEPNLPHFWKPEPDATRYATWAKAINAVIKQEDPTAQVAFGSVAVIDVGYSASQISGRSMIETLLGSGVSPEHVSLHPYAFGNEPPEDHAPDDKANTFRDVETMRALLVQKGLSTTQIWITEFGWQAGSTKGTPPVTMTEATQADYLRRSLEMVASKWPYVSRVAWFWDWDRGKNFEGWGLVRFDGTHRPAGTAFVNFVKSH